MAAVESLPVIEQVTTELTQDDKTPILSDKEFYAIFLDFIDN